MLVARGQHIKHAVGRIGDDLRIDSSLLDPDSLWQRPSAGAMRFGRVDTLGCYVSDVDPHPDVAGRRGGTIGSSLFGGRRTEKSRLDEEMALQVARMIINDVAMTTRSSDPDSVRTDPDSTGRDPNPTGGGGASFQL